MNKFEIVCAFNPADVEEQLREISPTLAVRGTLFIRLYGKSLPVKEWNDFVIIVITWWLNDLKILLETGRAVLDFMDDNYKMAIQLEKSNVIISFFHEGRNEFYVRKMKLSVQTFANGLFEAAYQLENCLAPVSKELLRNCNDYVEFKTALATSEKVWRESQHKVG